MFCKLFNNNAYILDVLSFCCPLYSCFQYQTCSRDCELPFLLKFSDNIILSKSVMTDATRITYLRRYFSVTLVSMNKCLPTWNRFEIYSESTMTTIQ